MHRPYSSIKQLRHELEYIRSGGKKVTSLKCNDIAVDLIHVHSKLHNIMLVASKVQVTFKEFYCVNMDA